jgi:polyisoprenoid-binding protein YceI
MKHVVLSAAALLSIAAAPAIAAPETFAIDPAHSTAIFRINHLGFSNTWGAFTDVAGTFVVDKDAPANSKVSVVIKTQSVTTNHAKRDDHLRSPDFLNAAEFPEMKFVSTKVEKSGDKTARITGNLTLLGVTKPVVLEAVEVGEGPHPMRKDQYHLGFSAKGKIKRSEFGMNYSVPAIGDDVDLVIEVEGIRQGG